MSNSWDPFTKDNSDLAGNGFYKKFNYQFTLASKSKTVGGPVLTNFLYAEKFLYGRVDRYYVPIQVVRSAKQKGLTATTEGNVSNLTALAFVVDAFNDLTLQFQKSLLAGKISAGETYLTAPKSPQSIRRSKIVIREASRLSYSRNERTLHKKQQTL